MKENLLRIRHKCNLYTYLFKSLVSDRFPYNKIGRRRRNMNKKRFCPNFQASTSTSKTLFYATLKLEPILKGGLPFPSPFRSFGVCRNTLSANKNANGRKRQSGKEFHLLSSCVMWVVKVNVSFLSSVVAWLIVRPLTEYASFFLSTPRCRSRIFRNGLFLLGASLSRDQKAIFNYGMVPCHTCPSLGCPLGSVLLCRWELKGSQDSLWAGLGLKRNNVGKCISIYIL